MTTLVIGARGAVGRHVLQQLLAAGVSVRASVRRLATADFPAQVEVVQADLDEPDSLAPALDGIDSVFLYAPSGGPQGFLDAARTAGVGHVVLMSSGSVLLPNLTHNAIADEHRAVEAACAQSGLHCTPIRPLVLANNALNWAESIRTEAVVRLVHPDAVTAPIHERDIAAVAVAALTQTSDAPFSDMLTGGESLTQRRQVELLAQTIGMPIDIEELSEDQARTRYRHFADPHTVEAILQLLTAAVTGGSPATTTAEDVLGRRPLSFVEWATEHAADFR